VSDSLLDKPSHLFKNIVIKFHLMIALPDTVILVNLDEKRPCLIATSLALGNMNSSWKESQE